MKKILMIAGLGCLVLLSIAFWSYVINISSSKKPNVPDEAWVKSAGQRYYTSQKKYYEVQSKTLGVAPDELNINNTPEKAEKTMRLCFSKIGKTRCEDVISGDTYIGEPKLWVEMTIGAYTSSRNTTSTKGVVHEQWVYGNPLYGATYMYFDNDVLTTVQSTSN